MLVRLAWIAAVAFIAPALSVPAFAQAQLGTWIADARTGCKAWDGFTGPRDSIAWSGACVNGFAQGRGVMQWFDNGVLGGTYDGEYRRGKADGQGTFHWPGGETYVGAWQNDLPNGWGTQTTRSGEQFTGNWINGCFKQGTRWTTAATTAEVCGFR